jgi:hypothetical protein
VLTDAGSPDRAVTVPDGAEKLLADMADVWEVCDVFVQVQQQPGNISPDDWQNLVHLAALMKQIAPDASLEEVEDALRSAFAKPLGDTK